MTTFLAVLSGLGTLFGLTVLISFVMGLAKANSQLALVLIDYSPFGWVIKCVCWFGAGWAGMSVFSAMVGA